MSQNMKNPSKDNWHWGAWNDYPRIQYSRGDSNLNPVSINVSILMFAFLPQYIYNKIHIYVYMYSYNIHIIQYIIYMIHVKHIQFEIQHNTVRITMDSSDSNLILSAWISNLMFAHQVQYIYTTNIHKS